jgi:hypothetical protein
MPLTSCFVPLVDRPKSPQFAVFFINSHARRDCAVRQIVAGLACKTFVKWYQAGVDVERRLPVLSTFLGHGHISETFWYLSGSSELLKEAAQRLENHWTVQP